MILVFKQVLVLFSFAAIGFYLAKSKKIKTEHTPILSSLLVNVILPFNVFKTFSANFTKEYVLNNYQLLIASSAVIICLAITLHFVAKLFDKRRYEQGIYEYSLIIPNYGYMGYPMAEAIGGAGGLLNAMVFGFPISFYTYTVGYCNLSKMKITLKKLFNPVVISMLIGAVFGFWGIKIPSVLSDVFGKTSACMGPVSMLLAGMVVSEFDFRELLSMKRIYIITALRLVIIPIIIGYALMPFNKIAMETAVILFAMPCGLNTIVFPRLVGEDCRIGAGLALLSNILACVTIPLVLGLFNIGG